MQDRNFKPTSENNGLLHPPSCACVKCAAGRDSQVLDESLRYRVKEMIDDTFLQQVSGNLMGAVQALGGGAPVTVVRSGFLANMGHIMLMREMAFAYFADETSDRE